jgi:hypothetical protein
VWHPELVALRRDLGRTRHPAQVIVSSRSALHIETALMFQVPEIPVYLVTTSDAASSLRLQVATRPWIQVIDGGQPLSMRTALRELRSRGIETVSAVGGGRRRARSCVNASCTISIDDVAEEGGEPNTPLLDAPLNAPAVVIKRGTGPEEGRPVCALCSPGRLKPVLYADSSSSAGKPCCFGRQVLPSLRSFCTTRTAHPPPAHAHAAQRVHLPFGHRLETQGHLEVLPQHLHRIDPLTVVATGRLIA